MNIYYPYTAHNGTNKASTVTFTLCTIKRQKSLTRRPLGLPATHEPLGATRCPLYVSCSISATVKDTSLNLCLDLHEYLSHLCAKFRDRNGSDDVSDATTEIIDSVPLGR